MSAAWNCSSRSTTPKPTDNRGPSGSTSGSQPTLISSKMSATTKKTTRIRSRNRRTMNRREFLAASGMTLAGATLSRAQTGSTPMERTIQTPTLDIGYVESGSATGFPVILLHGFPDDVHAYDDVAPPLAAAGHRVLVPYLRGYGPTRFRDAKTPRMAEQAAIAQDLVDFADALTLPRFAVAGYDWGGRAANVTMALHPDRVRAAVIVGGYTIQAALSPPRPSAPRVEAA